MDILSELGPASYRQIQADGWTGSVHHPKQDYVAEEVPVVLVYNDKPHVVMLCSPVDLEDFALGFSLTENIVTQASDIQSIRVYPRAKGIEVRLVIPEICATHMSDKGKNMTGRTGCGLCGATTLEQAIRPIRTVGHGQILDAEQLKHAFESMRQKQHINSLTGAVHAAGWLDQNQTVLQVREDVGRHNALDKLIGSLAKTCYDFDQGWLLVTSRASYEMVQKAASVGITLLAAISAPTALAIRLAEQAGLTLVGFSRGDNHVIYTHPHRLQHSFIK